MSGGVDSSVAAALLVEQGHEVEGAYMKNWINEEKVLGDCPWEQDIADARTQELWVRALSCAGEPR